MSTFTISKIPDPRVALLAFSVTVGGTIDDDIVPSISLATGDYDDGDFVGAAATSAESMQPKKENLHEFIGRKEGTGS